MTGFESLKGLIEKVVEARLGSLPAYQKVKDVIEGKEKKADIKDMAMDVRASFSADRKPELLVAEAIAGINGLVVNRIAASVRKDLSIKTEDLKDNLEKAAAKIENRPSKKIVEVGKKEAALSGRLVMDDGKTPVEGASVVVHGTGDNYSKIVAKAVTDANGEFTIRLDEKIAKEAPRKLTVAFDSPGGENMAHSGDFDLVKGKAITVDSSVRAEKKAVAEPLVSGTGESKKSAELEMSALKKKEVVLNRSSFAVEKSVSEITAKLDGLKGVFVKKTP